MKNAQFFAQITQDWALGSTITPAQPVSGGFLHKMFRLDTTSGSYAVKLLNPEIMSRPEALGNFQNAEALERVLEQNGLPIVAAMSRGGSKMQCIQGQYYYLFPWVAHKALPWASITEPHCSRMGSLLAQLHGLPWAQAVPADGSPSQPEPFAFDWESILSQAQEACPNLCASLTGCLHLLMDAQNAYNCAIRALPPLRCICNADMDAKNVLWQGNNPLVIDLECLEIGNPVNDLVQLSLSWAGGALCQMDQQRLLAFLRAYRKSSCLPAMDWTTISGLGFAWLDWLHYNLRRACGLTGASPEEKQLGIGQARDTMERIRFYAKVQPQVAALFSMAMASSRRSVTAPNVNKP